MNPSNFKPAAIALVRWLTHSEGGRVQLPTGPIYAATAVFAHEEHEVAHGVGQWHEPAEHFSIVLKFLEGSASTQLDQDAEVDFLARDLVKERLVPGARLRIMEGARAVAECEITSVLL